MSHQEVKFIMEEFEAKFPLDACVLFGISLDFQHNSSLSYFQNLTGTIVVSTPIYRFEINCPQALYCSGESGSDSLEAILRGYFTWRGNRQEQTDIGMAPLYVVPVGPSALQALPGQPYCNHYRNYSKAASIACWNQGDITLPVLLAASFKSLLVIQ